MTVNVECRACGHAAIKTGVQQVFSHARTHGHVGEFWSCDFCGSENGSVVVDPSVLYADRSSPNYALGSGTLFVLKQYFLRLSAWRSLRRYDRHVAVLDYGCGSGEYTNALRDLGFKTVVGADVLDSRPTALRASVRYAPISILNEAEKFDLIILRHVLEHAVHPLETLKSVADLLSSSGRIVIEVPSVRSAWKVAMGSRWPGYFFPYHTIVFSTRGLCILFDRAGFKVTALGGREVPILGVYLMSLGMPRFLSRAISALLYPVQVLVSRLCGRAEAIEVTGQYELLSIK